ncbi:MAG: MliC family protein [Rickettsiales bacterium]|jgi:membrane-bound inhibitor of C-type lysozyme|nr:MliC family protein [Rickettsiales bacterium]
MKKSLIAVAAVLMLGACDNSKHFKLDCEGHKIDVSMDGKGEKLTAVVDDRFSVKLDNVVSADGAKYEGQVIWGNAGELTYIWELILWNKGENWMTIIDTGFVLDCNVIK